MNAENLVDFTLELSEREIYNDIRAECDIVDILTVRPDATPEFFDLIEVQTRSDFVEVGQTRRFTVNARADHIEIQWEDAWATATPYTIFDLTQQQCLAIHPDAFWLDPASLPTQCHLPLVPPFTNHFMEVITRGPRSLTADITNLSPYRQRARLHATYYGLTPEKRFLKLRSHNATSEALYGRRVMDLVWPLGQHPTQMQAILDRYCDKHNMVQTVPGYGYEYGYEDESEEPEPICTARATIAGKTDELAEELLRYRIASFDSERGEYFAIPLIHPALGLTELSQERWYVNSINISDDVEGILEGTFGLEQQRAMERPLIFKLQSDPQDPDRDSRLFDAAPEENHVLA